MIRTRRMIEPGRRDEAGYTLYRGRGVHPAGAWRSGLPVGLRPNSKASGVLSSS